MSFFAHIFIKSISICVKQDQTDQRPMLHISSSSSFWQVYLCCMLPSVNDYTSHLQDATTVELAIKQWY